MSHRRIFIVVVMVVILLTSCTSLASNRETQVAAKDGSQYYDSVKGSSNLSESEIKTLRSLRQLDDYPLYRMDYSAPYGQAQDPGLRKSWNPDTVISWGCSLFTALGDPENPVYGRNFDWDYSPALLLFTDPSAGYASVSMVDFAYLGFEGQDVADLDDASLDELFPLLDAPYLPFDGMNETGLAVGMAAVPWDGVGFNQEKPKIGSLRIIREILDHAGNVSEAIHIFEAYQIDFKGGPPLHYLVADRLGKAALVEIDEGELHILVNQTHWHLATNYLVSNAESTQGICSRYDTIQEAMLDNQGYLTLDQSLSLLEQVSQESTQWSVVYRMGSGGVNVVMGKNYDQVIHEKLEMVDFDH